LEPALSGASICPARDLHVESLHAGGDPLLHLRDVLPKGKLVGIRTIVRSPAISVSLRGVTA
jgi:hypothetical protein